MDSPRNYVCWVYFAFRAFSPQDLSGNKKILGITGRTGESLHGSIELAYNTSAAPMDIVSN